MYVKKNLKPCLLEIAMKGFREFLSACMNYARCGSVFKREAGHV
jgi:hypothetical protein